MAPRSFPTLRSTAAVAALAAACGVAQAQPQQDDVSIAAFETVDSMQARVQGCTTCQGRRGEGTRHGYFPRIAGKPAAYLYHQLVAFRDGTRRYAPMNYLVAYLPDAYLREIAEHSPSCARRSRRSSRRRPMPP